MTLEVQVWSDYLCPWCYLGTERAAYLEREHGAEVVWYPYDLHPEIPEGGVDAQKAYDRVAPGQREAYLQRLQSLADEAGLEFRPPDRIPKTRKALEAAEWVRMNAGDTFPDFHRALFHAYWVEGRDIEDDDVLRELLSSAGADADAALSLVATGAMAGQVDRSTELAQRIGVSGTPAFLIDGAALVPGAQGHDVFDRVIERLRSKAPPQGEDASG